MENVELVGQESEKRLGKLSHKQRFGESMVGDRRETSPYEISFGDSVEWRLLCKKLLTPADLKKLKDAIHNNYFFEMFVEDLPMWGYVGDTADEDILVGEVEGSKVYLFTHLHFFLGHNNNQIVSAKVTTDVRFGLVIFCRTITTFLPLIEILVFVTVGSPSRYHKRRCGSPCSILLFR